MKEADRECRRKSKETKWERKERREKARDVSQKHCTWNMVAKINKKKDPFFLFIVWTTQNYNFYFRFVACHMHCNVHNLIRMSTTRFYFRISHNFHRGCHKVRFDIHLKFVAATDFIYPTRKVYIIKIAETSLRNDIFNSIWIW